MVGNHITIEAEPANNSQANVWAGQRLSGPLVFIYNMNRNQPVLNKRISLLLITFQRKVNLI